MKNITLKGMKTMPSEHEARDGELSLAINLMNHCGELHPRTLTEREMNLIVDSDGHAYQLMLRYHNMGIYERCDEDTGYHYYWCEEGDEEDCEEDEVEEETAGHVLLPLWHDDAGRRANALTEAGDLIVFAFDNQLVYFLYDELERQWHHLSHHELRYTIEVDQSQQRQVTVSVPLDSTLEGWLRHADQAVTGRTSLLKHLFAEWSDNNLATGATFALAMVEQALDRELSRGGSHLHKHVTFGITALRLFDGSHTLLSIPFALLPADGEPTLTIDSNGEQQFLRATTCLHSHPITVRFANTADAMMTRRLVQGIDLYLSHPMTLLNLCGATEIETDESGMATRLGYSWAHVNDLFSRLASATYHHVLHIAITDFGHAMVIPRSNDGEAIDISDLRRHHIGARVLCPIDDRLCAGGITQQEDSTFSIPVSYRYANLDGTARTTETGHLMECLCGERPDIDEQEEGLSADVVSVVHLRDGSTASTRTFINHVRYPLSGTFSYPDRRAYAMDLHLRFVDSIGTHHYRHSVSLRPLGRSGLSIGLWSGNSGGHPGSRHGVHSLLLQQAHSVAYDSENQRWLPVANLWTSESAEEWSAAAAEALLPAPLSTFSNRLHTSLPHNPLVFPEEGSLIVGDGIVTALIPRVKRYGGIQFGQYPLYAFCSDGVWALQRGDGPSWRGKYQVSRQRCAAGQPVEIDDQVLYLSEQGMVCLDGGKLTIMSDALSGEWFDAHALPYFDMMMDTLFGERFTHLPNGRFHVSSDSRLSYDRQLRQVSIVDPLLYLFATCDLDSGTWGMVEYGIDETETIPVLALTREISSPTHEAEHWRSVKVCGQFRRCSPMSAPLLCLMLWGSNDQYHWHLLGSSHCPVLRLPTGSPWRWHRLAVAGWMARDERISHVMIDN